MRSTSGVAVCEAYRLRTRVTEEPAVEPVSLSELKTHLKITSDLEDDYLESLIPVARMACEKYTKRRFITTGMEGYLDMVPAGEVWFEGMKTGTIRDFVMVRIVEIPELPVQTVDEVSTFNRTDTEAVFDAANYLVDVVDQDMPGRIVLRYAAVWPVDLREANSLRIQWTSGYGDDPEDVPAPIRSGILMLAAYLYTHRGECDNPESAIKSSGAAPFLFQYMVLGI